MKEVGELLNAMRSAGVILNYAIFGATAQMRYTEPVATLDADVLVVIPKGHPLDVLTPIYRFCQSLGYLPHGEAIQVGSWPVQFIPAFSPLTKEAVDEAEVADLDGVLVRVVGATYLAVIALSVGRAKDYLRILSLIEAGATSAEALESLAARHGLAGKWNEFRRRFLDS